MEAKKVLFILPHLGYGGTERSVYSIAHILMSMNMQISLFISYNKDTYIEGLPDNITLHFGAPRKSLSHMIKGLWKLRKLMKEHDIIFEGSEKRPTYLGYFIAMWLKKRKFALVHSTLPYLLNAKSKKHRFVMARAYPTYEKLIFVSRALMKNYQSLAKLKPYQVTTIYNPINFENIVELANRPIEIPWIKIANKPYITTLARIVPEKCLDVLITAYAKIHDQIPHQLIICGGGEDALLQSLKSLTKKLNIADKVFFIGHLKNPYPVLAKAELFVLSSETEGASIVLVEALILGKKIVSIDCPVGPREMLKDGKLGRLVPVNDADALANNIHAALQNNHTDGHLSERETFLQQFKKEHVAKQWSELLM